MSCMILHTRIMSDISLLYSKLGNPNVLVYLHMTSVLNIRQVLTYGAAHFYEDHYIS